MAGAEPALAEGVSLAGRPGGAARLRQPPQGLGRGRAGRPLRPLAGPPGTDPPPSALRAAAGPAASPRAVLRGLLKSWLRGMALCLKING